MTRRNSKGIMIEIPAGPLAVRIAKAAIGFEPPAHLTPTEVIAQLDEMEAGMGTRFLIAAQEAAKFFAECAGKGVRIQ